MFFFGARIHCTGCQAMRCNASATLRARADPRKLFGPDGKMLRPSEWPDDIANSVEALELKADGGIKVKVASKTAARRTILEHTGMLKSPLDGGMSALARALRGDLGLDEDGNGVSA